MHLGTNNFQVCITPILKFISVLLKLQGSRATHKHWPIEKIFGTDFFHNWNRLEGCQDIVSDFYFLSHTNMYVCLYVFTLASARMQLDSYWATGAKGLKSRWYKLGL